MNEQTRTQGLLDTSAVVLLSVLDESCLPDEPFICTITLGELSVGPLIAKSDEERALRQGHVQQAEADFDPIPFDAAAARQFGRVSAALHLSGRKAASRSYDALIAAVALTQDLPLYTANARDFAGIPGLIVHEVKPVG